MAYCKYCQKRGHTLEECYSKPKSFNPTKTFQKRHKRGPNGEIIIELVRRTNKKDEIQRSPKHDITKITISSNNENEANHKKSSIIPHKTHPSSFNEATNKEKNEVEIEIIKEVKHPVQPTTESKKQKSKFGFLPPITSSKKQVTQPKRTPHYISFKQPVIQPEIIQYQSQVEKDRIIIAAHNKNVMLMDMNRSLKVENGKLNDKINRFHNIITKQNSKIDDMAEEINHITSLRGKAKNKTVPTPGILPAKYVRINMDPEDSE